METLFQKLKDQKLQTMQRLYIDLFLFQPTHVNYLQTCTTRICHTSQPQSHYPCSPRTQLQQLKFRRLRMRMPLIIEYMIYTKVS